MSYSSEKGLCQNCQQNFVIEPEDFEFYEKIKVPPPTWCSECRMIRRMTWRNERELYKNKCKLTGKEVISPFSPNSKVNVYDKKEWWSDKWDPLDYGREYDLQKPFFVQFDELLKSVPMPAMFNNHCINSVYGNHSGNMKNSYLFFASWDAENLLYGSKILRSKDLVDVLVCNKCELCYEVSNSLNMYKVAYADISHNCDNSFFLYGCSGCSDCLGCVNLRNKSYHIFNKPYSKEDYLAKVREFDLGSYVAVKKLKQEFLLLKKGALRKYAQIINSPNSTGDNLANVNNCKNCFDITEDVRDSKFCINGGLKMSDVYDGYGLGDNTELIYESVDTGLRGAKLLFDIFVWGGNDINYSYACHNSHNLFACIGLRNKQYCILNKQYAKEQYEELIPRIIDHMNKMPYTDSQGRTYKYGEFFPSELSPFAYNETIAQEYYPLTEAEAKTKGYRWKIPEKKEYQATIISLPDHIKDVKDDILNQTIGCEHKGTCQHQCTTAFRIIPQELEFYRKLNLPLPRLCPNCRHYERLKQRNPFKLWKRNCMCGGMKSEKGAYTNQSPHFHGEEHCPNEFETSYAPEREEVVYCEKCYQQEVV